MFGATCNGRVVIADTTFRIHARPPPVTVTYDSFAAWARMIACGYTLRWIGFSEADAGAGAPSRRQPTARGRAVSIANALRTTRSTLVILSDDTAFVPLSKNGSAG